MKPLAPHDIACLLERAFAATRAAASLPPELAAWQLVDAAEGLIRAGQIDDARALIERVAVPEAAARILATLEAAAPTEEPTPSRRKR